MRNQPEATRTGSTSEFSNQQRTTSMRSIRTKTLAVAAVASLTMFTAACGSSDDTSSDTATSAAEETTEAPEPSEEDPAAGGAVDENLAGPGCGDYAKAVPDGSGSVAGMAEDPVAVAASNNPLLKTLTAAVSGKVNKKVDLVDTLNGDEFTVFAPVDDAFAAIDKKTLASLADPKNADLLTQILTYHVVPGQITPDKISGTQTTVQGEKLKVSGPADKLKTGGGQANVICGGVKTANATVYLIDAVMMPPSMS